MRVYKVELMIVDFDNLDSESIVEIIENTHYPNHCISPDVQTIDYRDIGEWSDDHPLNKKSTSYSTFRQIFNGNK